MKLLKAIIEKISILSLDVVAGVVCGCLMFARQMQVDVGWPQYFVLGSSVWLIYTIDHLLDATRKPTLVTLRHRFHQQYRLPLLILGTMVLVATAYVAFVFLPSKIIIFGLITGTGMGIYLMLIHVFDRKYFLKEVWVTTLYTIGVWGSVAIRAPHVRLTDWVTVIVFFILIFQDVLMLAWYEVEEDNLQQMFSSVHSRGMENVYFWLRQIIHTGLVGCVAGCLFFAKTQTDKWVWALLLCIAVVLATITYFPKMFRPGYLYRFVGDGILVLPVLIVFLDSKGG